MPFDKGDFTQQGVAGHVNANLRLNEKRLVNIDMTSNEEAEGCTIAGTVTDLLNDKVYPIGSGGGGGGTGTDLITDNGVFTLEFLSQFEEINVQAGIRYINVFINNTSGDNILLNNQSVTNERFLINPVLDTGVGDTYRMPVYIDEANPPVYYALLSLDPSYSIAYSNAVNVTFDDEDRSEGYYYFYVIDATMVESEMGRISINISKLQ